MKHQSIRLLARSSGWGNNLGGEPVYCVGVDWADRSHAICIIDPNRLKIDEFFIDHQPQGFAALHARIAALGLSVDEVGFVCETRNNLLIDHLVNLGRQVFIANPKSADRYRDRFRTSDSKSDGADAFVLASMLATDKESLVRAEKPSHEVSQADQLSRFRGRLVAERTRTMNELTSCLKSYYPRALELFDLNTVIFVTYMRRYPTPGSIAQETQEGFMAFLKSAKYTRLYSAGKLLELAIAPQIKIDADKESQSLFAIMLVDRLELLNRQIKELDKKIENLVEGFKPAAILTTLPGASHTLAAALIAELGRVPSRLSSASAVQCLAGTAPVTRQSGKYKYVKMRRACNKRLRNAVQQLSFSSITRCSWAREFYDNQRAKGKRHHQALRALGNKWIRIVHKMIETEQPYDEKLYLETKLRFSSSMKCEMPSKTRA